MLGVRRSATSLPLKSLYQFTVINFDCAPPNHITHFKETIQRQYYNSPTKQKHIEKTAKKPSTNIVKHARKKPENKQQFKKTLEKTYHDDKIYSKKHTISKLKTLYEFTIIHTHEPPPKKAQGRPPKNTTNHMSKFTKTGRADE